MAKIIILLVVVAICSTAIAQIVRPCKFSDHKCIGNYLAANSNCDTNVWGSLPNQYLMKEFRFETPSFNASHDDQYVLVKNHDKCKVSEFYFNTNSGKIVLTVDCPKLDMEAYRVLIQHRSKREDVYYYYNVHATYPMIRMTVNLPTVADLCEAHVFTEVVALPKFSINPKDKRTANILSHLDIYERENFLPRGNSLMGIFMTSLICDYGCFPHIH